MIDANSDDLSFETPTQVEAYCRFFLSVRPSDSLAEFPSQEEFDEYQNKRERALHAQLDELSRIDFTKANRQKVEGTYFKITKKSHVNPLSSEGSNKASTRFNFKDIPLLRNRAIYLGKSKLGCEYELFHLEDQRRILKNKFLPDPNANQDDFIFPDHVVYEYEVSLDNVLILTTKPSCDAIFIQTRVILNEWYEHNYQFDIPTAGQVLATLARIQGFKGILYTSTRIQTETNLVVFEENSGELSFKQISKTPYNQPSEWLLK